MQNTFSIILGGDTFIGEFPEKCPLCNVIVHTGNPLATHGFQAVFSCPNCDRVFIGYYSPLGKVSDTQSLDPYYLKLDYLKPRRMYIHDFSEEIQEISPNFILIFSEAFEAKELGLLQICGGGFRKAAEFLIKDYAKQKTNDEKIKKDIESKFVDKVVKDYIADTRIQEIASRTFWIGNDETHYLRKWTDYDVNDLITLIRLTIHWIEMDVLSKKFISEMPKSK